jgi:hypothetical protein
MSYYARATGEEVYVFTYQEEWKRYKELEQLPNRCFYAKHKIEGGVLSLYAAGVLPAYEEFKVEKEDFEKFMGEIVFGKRYLLERKSKKIKVEVKPAEEALNC